MLDLIMDLSRGAGRRISMTMRRGMTKGDTERQREIFFGRGANGENHVDTERETEHAYEDVGERK